FDDAHFNEQTMVKIGHENAAAELSGVSVVASQFGQGAGAGVVAVIGPTRMNYSQVIQAVRAAKCALRDL
ncbi:MAG: heat-inducible transcription repressor HrcA, partial [Raoultibacter sp.]